MTQRQLVSLGMFIVDEFLFEDEDGNSTGRSLDPQVCGLRTHQWRPLRFLHPTCVFVAYPPPFLTSTQIGGGGTYAAIGARIWLVIDTPKSIRYDLIVAWPRRRLDPSDVGMVVDRGHDFPSHIQAKLDSYGSDMWLFRDDPTRGTTKAMNHYRGDYRGFVIRLFFISNL